MAFWRRINQSKLQQFSNQWRRFYFQAPSASSIDRTRISVLEKPVSWIDQKLPYFYSNVRFFAAPFQAKSNKKEEASNDGTRLNEQIKADFVRLVTEEGHAIVSIREALERAKKLDLDLVEVQRNAKPPVCKLMDFYQERYKQQVKEKDRAKSKSGEALKKGECKEIRFTEKIEAKDLKMKAESVIRLMERGYRVKCMAMGKGKEDEDENLGGLLSRLTDLIEDVSVVESGPRVERKQAYVIVRHVKFGPLKKSGGKSLKVVRDTTAEPPTSSGADSQEHSESENEVLSDEDTLPTSSPMQLQDKKLDDKKTARSISESDIDFDNLLNINGGVSSKSTSKGIHATQRTNHSLNDYASRFSHPKPATNSGGTNTSEYPHPATSPGVGNRYKRSEPGNQFPPARSMGQFTRESVRLEPRLSNQQQQPPQNMNAPWLSNQQQQPPHNMNARSSVREANQVRDNASPFRNSRPRSNDLPQQRPSHSNVNVPGTPAPSFGIFSAAKANSSGQKGTATDAHGSNTGNNTGNRYASVRNHGMGGNGASGTQRQNGDIGGKDRFGIFSRDNSNTAPNRTP